MVEKAERDEGHCMAMAFLGAYGGIRDPKNRSVGRIAFRLMAH